MLFGYGARNCWCFKDWLDIDLRLNGNVPKDISLGYNFATILGFEGANASGKTNALKVFAFIADFATNSFLYPVEDEILFDSFFSNEDISEFYVEFSSNNVEYRYECILNKNSVVKEVLIKIEDSSELIIFERNNNNVTKNTLYEDSINIIYRENASFISTLHQYDVKTIGEFYDFFSKITINVTYTGLHQRISRDISIVSNLYFNNPQALQFTTDLIRKFDTGIYKIDIVYREDEKNRRIYYPIFYHDIADLDKALTIDQESSGTRALYIDLFHYYINLQRGGVLILDEFDINLHPDILPYLLKLFTDKNTNPRSAQMLFTTHNSEILDVLGKYRTYIVSKENGESIAYRLDEIKTKILRNDRSISVPYKRHFIGGYPKIEA